MKKSPWRVTVRRRLPLLVKLIFSRVVLSQYEQWPQSHLTVNFYKQIENRPWKWKILTAYCRELKSFPSHLSGGEISPLNTSLNHDMGTCPDNTLCVCVCACMCKCLCLPSETNITATYLFSWVAPVPINWINKCMVNVSLVFLKAHKATKRSKYWNSAQDIFRLLSDRNLWKTHCLASVLIFMKLFP